MNILVNLSSLLLGQALVALLESRRETCRPALARPGQPEPWEPDHVLVDAATLERLDPARWPGAKRILVDTGLSEDQITRLLLTHRLHGVISTGTDIELFHKALETIHGDQVWIDNDKLRALMRNPELASQAAGIESFSRRERDIALLIAEGRRNREIAEQLRISEQTVKSHLSRIFRKAHIASRAQLAWLAMALRS